MKIQFDLFHFGKKRKSIPKTWCGSWTDAYGKQLIIEATEKGRYLVTVLNNQQQYFIINLPGDIEKETLALPGQFVMDRSREPVLQVEAGLPGKGPTLNLKFLTEVEDEKFRLAKNSDNLKKIRIKPEVGMGLYDDWEDDLGVPWAFPFSNFIKN
ncbi:MAG: hypothetical protein H6574_22540 [Lewinellaceae bacterium]|nr:hypothetical protein [Saprospiraceae bacterium]MCB9333843.1 hypothetical protein [Lewinellaceae bacterium]